MSNKILFLIGPPRSLSTAFLRMMQVRGDFKVMNEPSSAVFNTKHYPQSKHAYTTQALSSYAEVTNKIKEQAAHQSVFIKEMSFAFDEYIQAEPSMLLDPRVSYVFLLRDPHQCIISYYQKMDPRFADYLIGDLGKLTGFRALLHSFKTVQDKAVNKPFLLDVATLCNNPIETMESLCIHMGLEHKPASLQWQNLSADFDGHKEWDESKKKESTQHWHLDAILSRRFHQPTRYELDEELNPTFTEIANPRHKKHCIDVYIDSKQVYEEMLNA